MIAVLLVVGIVALIIARGRLPQLLQHLAQLRLGIQRLFPGRGHLSGAAFTLRTGGQVRVAFLTTSRNAHVARITEFVATVFGTAITCYLAWSLVLFAWRAWDAGSTSFTVVAVRWSIRPRRWRWARCCSRCR